MTCHAAGVTTCHDMRLMYPFASFTLRNSCTVLLSLRPGSFRFFLGFRLLLAAVWVSGQFLIKC